MPPDAKLTPVQRSSSLRSVPRYAGTRSFKPSREATKSVGIRPLEKRPVGTPPLRSLPYGLKLDLVSVRTALLLPVSTMESPNTRMAGTRGLPPPTALACCNGDAASTSSSSSDIAVPPSSMSCIPNHWRYGSILATVAG